MKFLRRVSLLLSGKQDEDERETRNTVDEAPSSDDIYHIPIACSCGGTTPSSSIFLPTSLVMADLRTPRHLKQKRRSSFAIGDEQEDATMALVPRVSLSSDEDEVGFYVNPALMEEEDTMSSASGSDDDTNMDESLPGTNHDRFHAVLLNRIGGRDTSLGLVDAKCVTHVSKGALLVTDLLHSSVWMYGRGGQMRTSYMLRNAAEPWGVVMTPTGRVAVTLRRAHCVVLWSRNGQTMEIVGQNHLKTPAGLAVDQIGRLFVVDEEANDVVVFDHTGSFLFKLSSASKMTFKQPRYVCCSNSGRIIVTDSGNHCFKVFDQDGHFLFKVGSFGKDDGQFKFPYGVCVDQQDNIYLADHHNDRVVLFSKNGEFLQNLVTSESGLRSPCGISVRCAQNRKLYITHGELRASEVVVYSLKQTDSRISINTAEFV